MAEIIAPNQNSTPAQVAPTNPTPANLYEYYTGQGKTLPGTVADRFADPNFAAAAKSAGYDMNNYSINGNNADANTKILAALLSGKTSVGGTTSGDTTTKTDPTIGSIYNIPTGPDNTNINASADDLKAFYDNEAKGNPNVDEATIRRNTLAQFQAEIDATNNLFAGKLAEAKRAGLGRIGTNTAIEARRGLIGSDFGNAQTDTVNNANEEIYNNIEAERNAAVQSILGKSSEAATQAIKEKTAAMEAGLDARLKYYQTAGERKTANANTAATSIYQQGLTPDKLTPEQLQQTAKNYGITPEDIKTAFISVKTTGDATKALADKKTYTAVPAGSVIVDSNGKVIATGSEKLSTGQNLYTRNTDGSYTLKAQGQPKTTGTGGPSATTANLNSIGQTLKQYIGADTYADPYQYLNAYNHWVKTLGGSAATFLTKYPPKNYVNPAAASITNKDGTPLLPPALIPPKTTGRSH